MQSEEVPTEDTVDEETKKDSEEPSIADGADSQGDGTKKGTEESGMVDEGAKKETEEQSRADEGAEEEEEETCGFCKYMKGGGCREVFVSWMNCVEEEKEKDGDYVEQCIPHMTALRDCMLKNPEYYGPVLDEEAHMVDDEEESKDVPAAEAQNSQPLASESFARETSVSNESSSESEEGSQVENKKMEDPVPDEASVSQSADINASTVSTDGKGAEAHKERRMTEQ